ncbi:MAG TPA: hypothetical protein DDY37_05190 [Legionella sp.]|nr:hypothetical protein [Legionella sp.]
MHHSYKNVITRFLRQDERFVLSDEHDMPRVIEAEGSHDLEWLQTFLNEHSNQLLADISTYGAVLLRGFNITSEEAFEKTVLSIQGLTGISDAFMSEEGRIPAGNATFVLHTNAVYKTGGTLYLGGFHSENYYSTDVPAYICFCCLEPSRMGGETGLVNMKKIYQQLDPALQQKLEKNAFFVSEWLLTDIAKRYQVSIETIKAICHRADLPIVGDGADALVKMYKPNVLENPVTHEKSLHINLFEIHRLNAALRQCFMNDYSGKAWRWHRFVWKIPKHIFKSIKFVYIMFASFGYSPKQSLGILSSKIRVRAASKKQSRDPVFHQTRVGSCFSASEVTHLAQLIRQQYASCLWQKGDILLIDNTQVMHAGMPGAGKRVIRAMICNPIAMDYSPGAPGVIACCPKTSKTVGSCVKSKQQ